MPIPRPRTPAHWLCLLGGALLLVRGLGGFLVADSSFATPGEGWHHAIHVVSGCLLLAAWRAGEGPSRIAALGFGGLYLAVAGAGIVDGDDVLGLIGADAVDKAFHSVLGLVSLSAGMTSPLRAVPSRKADVAVRRAGP